MISLKIQTTDQIVDVGPFLKDDAEVYPEGARDKGSFTWPDHLEYQNSFCLPSRLYMFKLSSPRYSEQFWVEIFAYHFGCLIDVPVPPAFVAYNSVTKKAGALIEWFYDPNQDTFISGGDIMKALIKDYDRKKGWQHNLNTIFEYLATLRWDHGNWKRGWAQMLTFDALIGNTDRHQDNWGLIRNKGYSKEHVKLMAPAFDNGTSMGHEIPSNSFIKFTEMSNIERYIKKGRPHLMWDLNQIYKKRDNQELFLTKMLTAYPELRDNVTHCLEFSREKVQEILQHLTSFEISTPLSKERANFMLDLLCYRQKRLLTILELQ